MVNNICGGGVILQTKTASRQHGVVYFVLIFDQNAKNKYL